MVRGYPEIHGYPGVLEAGWLAGSFPFLSAPLQSSPDIASLKSPHASPMETENSHLWTLDSWSLDPGISESIPAACNPRILEVLDGLAGLEV